MGKWEPEVRHECDQSILVRSHECIRAKNGHFFGVVTRTKEGKRREGKGGRGREGEEKERGKGKKRGRKEKGKERKRREEEEEEEKEGRGRTGTFGVFSSLDIMRDFCITHDWSGGGRSARAQQAQQWRRRGGGEEEGEREGGEREGRREQKRLSRGRDTEVVSTRQSHDPSTCILFPSKFAPP